MYQAYAEQIYTTRNEQLPKPIADDRFLQINVPYVPNIHEEHQPKDNTLAAGK